MALEDEIVLPCSHSLALMDSGCSGTVMDDLDSSERWHTIIFLSANKHKYPAWKHIGLPLNFYEVEKKKRNIQRRCWRLKENCGTFCLIQYCRIGREASESWYRSTMSVVYQDNTYFSVLVHTGLHSYPLYPADSTEPSKDEKGEITWWQIVSNSQDQCNFIGWCMCFLT